MSWLIEIVKLQQETFELLKSVKADTTVIREGNAVILRILKSIESGFATKQDMLELTQAVQSIATAEQVLSNTVKENTEQLNKIINILVPQPAANFSATITLD